MPNHTESVPPVADLEALASLLQARRSGDTTSIIAITGAVAAGKSTLAQALLQHLAGQGPGVELVATDGFLLPNAILESAGLAMRKGFPESYDVAAMTAALHQVRFGQAHFPGYSHTLYDIDPALTRTLARPAVLIVEGLGLPRKAARRSPPLIDTLIYLDADEADLERWFITRFMRLWMAAKTDPTSFYARFRTMTEDQARAFALEIWTRINLPNLRDHIVHHREEADIIVYKDADHRLSVVRGPGQ